MDNQPVKQFEHSRNTIVRLFIGDRFGTAFDKEYKMKPGLNEFTCYAVHIDGYVEKFKAIWTCPIVYARGGYDMYGVLGNAPKETVSLSALDTYHYTELACWAYEPAKETPTGNAEIPHYSIGFDYSEIDNT